MSSGDNTTTMGDARQIEPLSPIEAHHATVEAVHAVGAGQAETLEARRHGMIEAETHRVSEEVTAQAQARLHLAAERVRPSVAPLIASQRSLPAALSIKQILVPLDGTPETECALPYAAAVAQRSGAAITLVNVAGPDLPNPAAVVDRVVNSVIESKGTAHPDMPAYLAQLRERVAAVVPHVNYQVLHAASPIEALVAYEERGHEDLVVLATRRHMRAGLYPAGRLAESMLRRGPAALLLVPIEGQLSAAQVAPLTRLLVPLDGSALSETALAALRALFTDTANAEPVRRHVTLLTINEHFVTQDESEMYLAQVRASLEVALAPALVEFETLAAHGTAAEVIVDVANGVKTENGPQAPYDLVLMATHGRGGVGRWLFGSVAEYALQALTIPMLLLRAQHAN